MDENAPAGRLPERDRPWVMRTYAGHSSATATNALFRRNLAKGQTGLSVAFDLPTQTGYDPDHELRRRRGRPGRRAGRRTSATCGRLFEGIPLAEMNTSMTINAPAMWLLALYPVAAGQGAEPARCAGTTQNDIIKEYLSRGTYIFPPGRVAAADRGRHRVHAARRCRGGTRSTSAATTCRRPARRRCRRSRFALATAIAVLDAVRDAGQVSAERIRAGRGADLLLRQRRGAVRRGDRARCARSARSGTRSPATATA